LTGKVLLAIDCGTQSLRAMLFSPTGDLLAKARETYPPISAADRAGPDRIRSCIGPPSARPAPGCIKITAIFGPALPV
jgi:glycerol kinase